jgi:hypothetical protein
MLDRIPTLPASTRPEHQAAVQAIFDDEHEPQVFLISPAESNRVAADHACNSLQPGELIGLLPDGSYQDYSFTNNGRAWSRQRDTFRRNGEYAGPAGACFLAQPPDTDGYLHVKLFDAHGPHTRLVNPLIAQVHLANPRHFPEVNHIDHNPANNHVSNLEWGTKRYNNLHVLLHNQPGTLFGVTEYSHDPHLNPSWRKPFKARATLLNGQRKHIGRFATVLDAAREFDDFIFKYGIPTWLNFSE